MSTREKGIDEVMYLAGIFQVAGFPCVVGMIWQADHDVFLLQ